MENSPQNICGNTDNFDSVALRPCAKRRNDSVEVMEHWERVEPPPSRFQGHPRNLYKTNEKLLCNPTDTLSHHRLVS